MAMTCIDDCTLCGKENVQVTIIHDDERVCDECLDSDYVFCDECEEYWAYDAVSFFELDDGRNVCEYCYEMINEEEDEDIEYDEDESDE